MGAGPTDVSHRFGRLASTHLSGGRQWGAYSGGLQSVATDSGHVQTLTCLPTIYRGPLDVAVV